MRARLVVAAGVLGLSIASACLAQQHGDDPASVLKREPVVVWVLRSGHPSPPPEGIAAIMPPQPRFPLREVTVSGLGPSPAASAPAASGPAASGPAKSAAQGGRPRDYAVVDVVLHDNRGARSSIVDLYLEDLTKELKAAKSKNELPDVLVGELPSTVESWRMEHGDGPFLPTAIYGDAYPDNLRGVTRLSNLHIFRDAPHPEAARALAQLVSEWGWMDTHPELPPLARTQPGLVAVGVMSRLLHGITPGMDADPMLAEFSLDGVMRSRNPAGYWTDAEPNIQVMNERVDGSLAAIALRVIVSSDKSFTLLHPMLVLRKVEDGSWKVVQVSFDLRVERQRDEAARLMASSPPGAQERSGGVKGVRVASPVDGDNRLPQPELWWDNLGGAGLQLVEWQQSQRDRGPWSDSHLYFVPDQDSLLHTRQVAQFATGAGSWYRWRVWSVGDNGELKLSDWRTFGVLP